MQFASGAVHSTKLEQHNKRIRHAVLKDLIEQTPLQCKFIPLSKFYYVTIKKEHKLIYVID